MFVAKEGGFRFAVHVSKMAVLDCSEVQNGAEELAGGAVRFVGKIMADNEVM